MGTTANMWLNDSQGNWVKGDSLIHNRIDSIELLSIDHSIHAPFDSETGKNTRLRKHLPFTIMKRIDRATPYLNKACCNGETIQSIEILVLA
jgi:type VI secretion system secreted protein Hcp